MDYKSELIQILTEMRRINEKLDRLIAAGNDTNRNLADLATIEKTAPKTQYLAPSPQLPAPAENPVPTPVNQPKQSIDDYTYN